MYILEIKGIVSKITILKEKKKKRIGFDDACKIETYLLNFQSKFDVAGGKFGSLGVPREFQCFCGDVLDLVFQGLPQKVNCIPGDDLGTNALHEVSFLQGA